MPTTTYTFSIASDFGGNIDPYELQMQIVASPIAEPIQYVNTDDDVVAIVFANELTGPDQTILANIITNYTAAPEVSRTVLATLVPREKTYSSTSYARMSTFVYNGTLHSPPITAVSFVGYMMPGSVSFTIRMLALLTPSVVILEEAFTNTTEAMQTITNISNLPTQQSVIEFQVKRNATGGGTAIGKTVHMDSITIMI